MNIDTETDEVAILADDLSRAIFRLSRILRWKQASSVGLSQLSALAVLSVHGPMSPRALARFEQVKPPSMTRVLALLEGAGLIERAKHPTDGRQLVVSISEAGEKLVAAERCNRQRWLGERAGRLPADHQETLRVAARILMDMADE